MAAAMMMTVAGTMTTNTVNAATVRKKAGIINMSNI